MMLGTSRRQVQPKSRRHKRQRALDLPIQKSCALRGFDPPLNGCMTSKREWNGRTQDANDM
eukprot:5590393-Amphidinium_carterae.1